MEREGISEMGECSDRFEIEFVDACEKYPTCR